MAEVYCIVQRTIRLSQPTPRVHLQEPLVYSDELAHAFRVVAVSEPDDNLSLIGAAVVGTFLKPDGDTVFPITGPTPELVDGGYMVQVVLPASCYTVPGRFKFTMTVGNGETVRTVLMVDGIIEQRNSETIIDPGTPVTNYETIIANATAAAQSAMIASAKVDNLYCMKEDILGEYGDLIISDPESDTFKRYGDEVTGKRWSFDTDDEYGSEGKYYYAVYAIPNGTQIIGVSAWNYSDSIAAFGFYNGDPKDGGTQVFHITGLPAGYIKCATNVPSNATHLLVQLASNPNTRGVYPFTSTRSYVNEGHEALVKVNQALHMVNKTIHSFNQMVIALPCSSDPEKASFDEAGVGVVYFVGFTPAEKYHSKIIGMPEYKSGSLITLGAHATYTAGATQLYITSTDTIYVRTKISSTWRAWHNLLLSGEVETLVDSAIDSAIETVVSKEVEYHVGAGRDYTSFVSLLMQLAGDETPKVIYIDQGTYDIYAEYVASSVPEPPEPDSTAGSGFANYNAIIPKNTRVVGIGDVVFDFQLPKTIAYHTSRIWSCLNLVYGNTTVENLTLHCKNCRYGIHDESDNAYTGYTNYYRNVRIIMEEADKIEDSTNPHYNEKLGYGPTIGFGFEDKTTYIFENCHFTNYCNGGNVSAFYGHDGSSVGGAKVMATNCIFETYTSGGDPATTNTSCIRMQSIRDWTPGTSRANVATFNNCYATGGIRLQNYGGEQHTGGSAYGGMWDVVLLHSGNPAQTIDEAKRTGKVSVYE